MTEKRIKLLAMDSEDLTVLSAHCQDGVVKTSDINFIKSENRFVAEMNRFVWENSVKKRWFKKSIPERRRSVLHFEQVQSVASIGIDLSAKHAINALLAIKFEETNAPSGIVELIFSSSNDEKSVTNKEITIRLEVECIEAQLADMPSSWAASSTPKHST